AFTGTLATMASDMLNSYVDENYNEMLKCAIIKKSQVDEIVDHYMQSDNGKSLLAELEADYVVPQDTFSAMYSEMLKGMLQGYVQMASTNPEDADPSAFLNAELVTALVPQLTQSDEIKAASEQIAGAMTEAVMQKTILTKVGELSGELMGSMASENAIADAFQFNLSEEELSRLMETMTDSGVEKNADTNLRTLGYQNLDEPTSMSFYFTDFDSKELFVDFIDEYNKKMESFDKERVITYTDITGILISSVSTIVNSVTYVLIAFVSISLIVSSIMIGIITYISVLERTKEIGVLRAIGASKRNISSIFNAETFIVGFCSGLLGIGVTLALVPLINYVIHSVTNNYNIRAVLPVEGATILVILSVILTLISGVIPSKQAAKKDPVLALRSE
ncbi:MAG: ABC transporter permease, partial [Lachnospiraceae bacterium]|nr:ABC transporter permease [Lachnospiraceae bacterium]